MASSSGALTKHGFPRGYRFAPDCLEIVDLLASRILGRPLPPPVAGIFHDIRVLDHHPKDLYEAYKEYEEAGCIYFFSRQEFPTPGGGRTGDPAGSSKKRRPVRAGNGGGWKPSGGAKQLRRPGNKGGGVAGRMVTMVFYERRRDPEEKLVKTSWGMHEFTVPVSPDKFSDIAVYRLYKVKNGNKENKQAAGEGNKQPNGPDHHHHVVADEQKPSTWTAAGYQAGTSTSNQALVAASSSQEQKPFSIGQIHQHYYNQYAFAAAGMPGPSTWVPPAAAVMPGPSSWMPPAATNPKDHAPGPRQPGYEFMAPSEPLTEAPPAVNPGEQQTPTPAMHSSVYQFVDTNLPSPTPSEASPAAEQLGPAAMSSPPALEEGPSQLELPPPAPDEDEMAAVWNAVDASLLPFENDCMYDDFCDIAFTMDELTGTTMESDSPSGGTTSCSFINYVNT